VPQYNETLAGHEGSENQAAIQHYRSGMRDIAAILFYTIAWITGHAVIQEYILDKLQRRLHLSKTKTSKFHESGQLFVFCCYSMAHSAYILYDMAMHRDISMLWTGYPHRWMTLHTKIFFLVQIAFWLHQFPEFYFQKLKRDEMYSRSKYTIINLSFIIAAYVMSFNRLALALLFLEYMTQSLFHFSRMLHFADKKTVSDASFKIWNVLFVVVRAGSALLAVITFWMGLKKHEIPYMDADKGNYNTSFIRLNCLLFVLALQLYQMYNFVLFHYRRHKEKRATGKAKQIAKHKAITQQKKQKKINDEIAHLTEADQQVTRSQQKQQKKDI